MTVLGGFLLRLCWRSAGFEHTWDFKHSFGGTSLGKSPFYFTEPRSVLVQGSFRQKCRTMCIVTPEMQTSHKGLLPVLLKS